MSTLKSAIADVKNTLLQMSSLVEDTVKSSIVAFKQNNIELAHEIIARDKEIDEFENNIDKLILNIILTHSPKNNDLIFLLSAKQISEQLERVGDHAVNISEQIIALFKSDSIGIWSPGAIDMATIAIKMLGESINAFVFCDTNLAFNIRDTDKHVDDLYNNVINEEISSMEMDKTDVKSGVYNIILALNIERIADLATNIAEHVVFFVEGENIKHLSNEAFLTQKKQKNSSLPLQHATLFEKEKNKNLVNASELCSSDVKTREPLECLHNHAKYINMCMEKTYLTLNAYFESDTGLFKKYKDEVLQLEHAADLIKRNVRSHLPRGIIMPIDKFELFMYLAEQDNITNTAEELVYWLSYKQITVKLSIREDISGLFRKCLEISSTFPGLLGDVKSFFQTGDETIRDKIKETIRNLRKKETEADAIENKLKEIIFRDFKDTFTVYYLIRLIENIGKTADNMVSAADILRTMVAK